jgi:hypothetical protein
MNIVTVCGMTKLGCWPTDSDEVNGSAHGSIEGFADGDADSSAFGAG